MSHSYPHTTGCNAILSGVLIAVLLVASGCVGTYGGVSADLAELSATDRYKGVAGVAFGSTSPKSRPEFVVQARHGSSMSELGIGSHWNVLKPLDETVALLITPSLLMNLGDYRVYDTWSSDAGLFPPLTMSMTFGVGLGAGYRVDWGPDGPFIYARADLSKTSILRRNDTLPAQLTLNIGLRRFERAR